MTLPSPLPFLDGLKLGYEHMFAIPEYSYSVTEHDQDRPWLVLGMSHGTVTLDDDVSFFEWAGEHWPAPRWSVDLDPWQLSRHLGASPRRE